MAELTHEIWERKFRADAEADNLAIFRDHLRGLDLQERTTAESMLEGTIRVVDMCCLSASLDGRSAGRFLAAQTYDPAGSAAFTYAFTFDIWGEACARLLVAAHLETPGLAHLFDHPWYRYEVSGYTGTLIYRPSPYYFSDSAFTEDSWLNQFMSADLVLGPGSETAQSCPWESRAIGSFYVSVRRRRQKHKVEEDDRADF